MRFAFAADCFIVHRIFLITPVSRFEGICLISFRLVSENKAIGVMKPGHTFTIEPMINAGKANVGEEEEEENVSSFRNVA